MFHILCHGREVKLEPQRRSDCDQLAGARGCPVLRSSGVHPFSWGLCVQERGSVSFQQLENHRETSPHATYSRSDDMPQREETRPGIYRPSALQRRWLCCEQHRCPSCCCVQNQSSALQRNVPPPPGECFNPWWCSQLRCWFGGEQQSSPQGLLPCTTHAQGREAPQGARRCRLWESLEPCH